MRRIILAASVALAACSAETAADNVANGTDANPLPPVVPGEPLDGTGDDTTPPANLAVDDRAATVTESRTRPDRSRPYQPFPPEPPPPERHDGNDRNEIEG